MSVSVLVQFNNFKLYFKFQTEKIRYNRSVNKEQSFKGFKNSTPFFVGLVSCGTVAFNGIIFFLLE